MNDIATFFLLNKCVSLCSIATYISNIMLFAPGLLFAKLNRAHVELFTGSCFEALVDIKVYPCRCVPLDCRGGWQIVFVAYFL